MACAVHLGFWVPPSPSNIHADQFPLSEKKYIINVRDLWSNNKLPGQGEIEHSTAGSDSQLQICYVGDLRLIFLSDCYRQVVTHPT